MKNIFKLALSSLALLTFGLASCGETGGSSSSSHNNKMVESVSISEEYLTASIGDSFVLFSEIKFRDDKEVEVSKRWASSKLSVARITVSDDYESCEVEVVGSGTTQISFIAGYQSAICTIYVPSVDPTPGPTPTPGPGGETVITLSPFSRTMSVGEEFNLVATVSPLADATFTLDNSGIIEITNYTTSACVIKALNPGETDVTVTAGDGSAKCHIVVLDEEEQGDKDYTVYFYIDYNNTNPKDETNLLAKFDWYYDRPLIEAKKPDGTSLIPTVTNDMKKDDAFPYFIGWSTHPIIDTKENLWDLNKDTIADLPMMSYTVTLYGQWFDVPVLPAQEEAI